MRISAKKERIQVADDKDIARPEHIGLDSKSRAIQDKVDIAHEIMGDGSTCE